MIQSLLSSEAISAVKFFGDSFLADNGYEAKTVAKTDIGNAKFFAAERILVPGKEAETFKLTLPLVRWVILKRIIPAVFPSYLQDKVLFCFPNILDILVVLKLSFYAFDKDIMKFAPIRLYKLKWLKYM